MSLNASYEKLSAEELRLAYDACIPKELHHGYYHHRGYVFTAMYEGIQQSIEDLEVHDSDIWVTSVPKSGTTWLSEMVWSICNDLTSPEAQEPLNDRVRFLEYSSLYRFDDDSAAPAEVTNSVQKVKDMSQPRIIKTHNPWPCLPKELRNFTKRPRVLHVARDPKDVAVSYFHHNRKMRGFSGPAELFYEMFLRGPMRWSPYASNVQSYWSHRHEPNVLFLRFEDMKSDMRSSILKIAQFLDVACDDNKMAALLEHLSFKSMKKNDNLGVDHIVEYINARFLHEDQIGGFLRKGESRTHRSEMSANMAKRIDDLMSYCADTY